MLGEELINKIKLALSNSNDNLIGEKDFYDEELEEIKDYLSCKFFNYSVNDLPDSDIEMFIVFVINKLKHWNKDWSGSKFWDRIKSMFDDNPNVTKSFGKVNLNERINGIFDKYERIVFKSEAGRQFAQTFLYQGFSPKDSFCAFIQLCWNIYIDEEILDQYYVDDDFDFCKKIISNLNSKFSKDLEEQNIQFDGAVYNIKASLQYGFLQNYEKSVILLNRILKYIHRVHTNKEDILDNHLGNLVTDKINSIKKIDFSSKSKRSKTSNVRKDRVNSLEKMIPQYSIKHENDSFNLFISYPKLLLSREEEIYKTFKIIVKNNKNTIYESDEFYVRTRESLQIIMPFEIDITDLIKSIEDKFNLEFILMFDNGKSVSSGNLLYRNILLFNDFTEKRSNCKTGDYYLITPNKFDSNNNLHLSDKKLLNQIGINVFSFYAVDGDVIDYDNEIIYFGSLNKSDFFFKNVGLKAMDKIKGLHNGEEIDIFSNIADLLLTIRKNENVNNIYLCHIHNPLYKEDIIKNEYLISDFEMEGKRYLINSEKLQLNSFGFHELQINKLTAGGYKSILPPIKYYIDGEIKYNSNNKNAYFNANMKLDVRILGQTFTIFPTNNIKKTTINVDDYEFIVDTPYLWWWFGSKFDEQVHYATINTNKPIFIDEIINPNESIVLDTNLNVDSIIFIESLSKREYVIPFDTKTNSYQLGVFLSDKKIIGTFYVRLDNQSMMPLFSLTYKPYLIQRLIEDSFSLTDESFVINLSNCFVHGRANYRIELVLKSDYYEDIIFSNIDPDSSNTFDVSQIIDGEFEIDFVYQKNIGGLLGDKHHLSINNPVLIGNPLKVLFDDIDRINILKTRINENTTVKFKDIFLDNIIFEKVDDDDYCVYAAKLHTASYKKGIEVKFVLKDEDTIRKIIFKEKELNIDLNKKDFTTAMADEKNIINISSLYIKY